MDISSVYTWKLKGEVEDNIKAYMVRLHEVLTSRLTLIDEINDQYFTENDFDTLAKDNFNFYSELIENYDRSYANPRYTQTQLPEHIADIASATYYEVLTMLPYIFQKREIRIDFIVEKFYTIVDALQNDQDVLEAMSALYGRRKSQLMEEETYLDYAKDSFYSELCKHNDLHDLRYLFRYGIYISDTELAYANVLQTYDEKKIRALAKQMVDCYLKGFRIERKSYETRNISRIIQIVGLEKVGRYIFQYLHENNLDGTIAQIVYRNHNAQAIADYDVCSKYVYTDKNLNSEYEEYMGVLKRLSSLLLAYQGNIIMVSFAQKKVDISMYQTHCKPNFEFMKAVEINRTLALRQWIKKEEISYTGMAFPAKDITEEDYRTIFDHIMEINLMKDTKLEEIHEILIEALDQGEKVHLKGYKGNKTDVEIALRPLEDPLTETNFVNCGAATNIPAGEIYTSPQLKNSNGLIHIQKVRISRIEFKDIELRLENGFVTAYGCKNTENDEENHELINSYIFHNRETLPIGEFALGTNTFAYSLAKQDGILYKLHTLIYEKLGPHIALGDTCFSWSEDFARYSNFTGKKIMAVDNEVSIKRKLDPTQAYFGVHYDLTIPYDEMEEITVWTKEQAKIPIVKNGCFVLPGCESLNQYLNKDEGYEKT